MRNIISWEEPVNLGKLPDSEWICPLGDLTTIGDLALAGEVIRDEDIQMLAEGRPQHLNLIRYPEGYETVEVVDSATGKVLNEEGMTKKYIGLDDSQDDIPKPLAMPVFFRDWLPMNGRYLRPLAHYEESGLGSTIGAGQLDDETSEAYMFTSLSAAHVQAAPRHFRLDSYGALPKIPDGEAALHVYDHGGQASGVLTIASRNLWREIGEFNLRLDGEGRIEQVEVRRPNILKLLSIETPVTFDKYNQRAIVDKPADKASLLSEIADRIGLGEWGDIDLSATAQRLYAAMPEEGAPNPMHHLQFR
jgi:hypothetical protein